MRYYNKEVFEISDYARWAMEYGIVDEAFTEYRTLKVLQKGRV